MPSLPFPRTIHSTHPRCVPSTPYTLDSCVPDSVLWCRAQMKFEPPIFHPNSEFSDVLLTTWSFSSMSRQSTPTEKSASQYCIRLATTPFSTKAPPNAGPLSRVLRSTLLSPVASWSICLTQIRAGFCSVSSVCWQSPMLKVEQICTLCCRRVVSLRVSHVIIHSAVMPA